MKRSVRVAVLVALAWFPSAHAAQPSATPSKGPVVVKQSPILDLERWLKDKIRRLGATILPTAPEVACAPDDPTGCTDIDRSKCPIP